MQERLSNKVADHPDLLSAKLETTATTSKDRPVTPRYPTTLIQIRVSFR